MSTLSAINLKHPSSGSNNIVLDSSGNATVANNVTVTGTGSVGGNLSFNSGYGSAAVAYGCRAWVNFNGTGTVAIRASGNVSSITDNGTGNYSVNFTTAMPDANYGYSHSYSDEVNGQHTVGFYVSVSTTAVRVAHFSAASAPATADKSYVLVAVFR